VGLTVLEAQRVSFRISNRLILDGVSLTLMRGEVLALVGPNGAGKTTLLKLLSGELVATAGQIRLDGKELSSYAARELARRRSVLTQSSASAFPFTALDVTLMGRHPHLGPAGETAGDVVIARAALAHAEALGFAERRYTTLSGGEQQRVNLARALAQEASIVLLDEPTTHLDPRHQHATLAIARALAAEGCAVLAILHDLNLAAMYADRVGLLVSGRLTALGEPWQVLTPERLEAAFGVRYSATRHPSLDRPLLVQLLSVKEVDTVCI